MFVMLWNDNTVGVNSIYEYRTLGKSNVGEGERTEDIRWSRPKGQKNRDTLGTRSEGPMDLPGYTRTVRIVEK